MTIEYQIDMALILLLQCNGLSNSIKFSTKFHFTFKHEYIYSSIYKIKLNQNQIFDVAKV